MYGYIYLTTNKVNGKKYIGQHAKPEFDNSYYGSGSILIKALQKYGKENFTCEPIDWAETKEELDQKEIEWIAEYNAMKSEEYYNIAPGGAGNGSGELSPNYGRHHSEEAKHKMSQSHMGEKNHMWGKCGELSPSFGIKHTEEQKEKISKALKGKYVGEKSSNWGKKFSEDHRKKIGEAHKGELNPRYGKGYLQAGERNPMWGKRGELNPMYGKPRSEETKKKISEALKGKFVGRDNPNYGNHKLAGANSPLCKPVVQLTLSGEFIKEYQYVKQVIIDGFKDPSAVVKCCKGKQKTYGGYKWMYKADYEKLVQTNQS